MFENLIHTIANFYPTGNKINYLITLVLNALVLHRAFFFAIGFLFTRKFKPAKKKHNYGILIAARNEKAVIGNLIDSIHKQDYPSDKYTIFVVADNCTDNTAEIAREKGAIVYERFDNKKKTKGFALEYLIENIEKDYRTDSFEGFFIFDADNLLKSNYINKMNDAFDEGCKIITSYRNSKNFDENWIASTYAIHWIRSIRTNHRARSFLRLATNLQGTGYLFSSELIKDGWHYTSLLEDRAFTADSVVKGYQISYQDEAEFFDEQPVNLKVAINQRMRWSKGLLQVFVKTGPKLFCNIFTGKKSVGKKNKKCKTFKDRLLNILESFRHRFASFDTFMHVLPIAVINVTRWLLFSVIIYAFYVFDNGLSGVNLFDGGSYVSSILANFFTVTINCSPGIKSLLLGLGVTLFIRIIYRIGLYFANMLMAIYIFITERKRIKKMPLSKKLICILTWPIFDIIGRYTTYAALFIDVTWKPIPHKSKVTIDDINNK